MLSGRLLTRTLLLTSLILTAATAPSDAGSRISPTPGGSSGGGAIVLPPGSNALVAAIAAAGRGGTVLLQAGVHHEDGTVLVGQPVTLRGEVGAVLETVTTRATVDPIPIEPALHIKNASDVRVEGIEFRPAAGTEGNYAILVDHSPSATFKGNVVRGHQGGILVDEGDNILIEGNDIEAGVNGQDLGITVMNGRSAQVINNRVNGGSFGIWANDRGGLATGNITSGAGFVGSILCKVPENGFIINGVLRGAEEPARDWTVRGNTSFGTVWGFLAIDGSNNNTLRQNTAYGNFLYDMELTGDTYRFGFLTPASYNNTVHESGMVIKDCGNGNRIIGSGATLVDTTADPCF